MSKQRELDDNENCPYVLWAEINRLREMLKGPDGFETWMDAAVAERLRRVDAERALAEEKAKRPKQKLPISAWLRQRRSEQ